jgi:hypothetical protein
MEYSNIPIGAKLLSSVYVYLQIAGVNCLSRNIFQGVGKKNSGGRLGKVFFAF